MVQKKRRTVSVWGMAKDGNAPSSKEKHLAVMMLAIDSIPHHKLWTQWCRLGKPSSPCTFYLNAKFLEKIPLQMHCHQIPEPVLNTQWGHVSLIEAHMALLKEALKNPQNEWYLLISSDSLPLNSISAIMKLLRELPSNGSIIGEAIPSRMNMVDLMRYVVEQDPARHVNNWWVQNYVSKKGARLCEHSQFQILSRAHAEFFLMLPSQILTDCQILFDGMMIAGLDGLGPDEIVLGTYLHLHMPQASSEIFDIDMMFAKMDSTRVHAGILNHTHILMWEDADRFFFGRKFDESFDIKQLKPLWRWRDRRMTIQKDFRFAKRLKTKSETAVRRSTRPPKPRFNVKNYAELDRLVFY